MLTFDELNALPKRVIVRGRDKGRGVCRYRVVVDEFQSAHYIWRA